MKTLEIPADILRLAQLFKSKKDARYYLNGVHFRTVGYDLTIEATDGTAACKMVAPSAGDFIDCDFILPCDFKIPKKSSTIVINTEDFKQFDIVMGNTITREQHIDAQYPSFDRIIPYILTGNAGQFDPEYLMKFRESSTLLGCGAAYKLQHNGTSAARVDIAKYQFLGMVMPWEIK